MRRLDSGLRLRIVFSCLLTISLHTIIYENSAQALTESHGQPYHGHLVNGIPFPNQFRGYQLREEERTYTTPEVIGAVLDAVDGVQKQFPGTCDLYIGDFSLSSGGRISRHRSHQNGRDVDLGMYAKGNRLLDTFVPMNEENLDVPRTWCLIEGLLRSQRVQYIFLDRKVQKLLYDYASAQGVDTNYLDRLFANARGSIIQHVVNHQDHLHVRFFTPWSTLAAHVGEMEDQKRTVIEMAQQAYLPKKVFYYAKGNEHNLESLAKSFGVTRRDLCLWNQLHPNDVLTPGKCLVFYKRGFELEPVYLAQSLQPNSVPETITPPPVQLASLRPTKAISDAPPPTPVREPTFKKEKNDIVSSPTYRVSKGDTLESIAKRNNMDTKTLCDINGLKKGARVRAGQTIKLASVAPADLPENRTSDSARLNKVKGLQNLALPVSREPAAPMTTTYTVGQGDTLPKIAKQKGIDVETLCLMNGMKKNCNLRPGQRIILAKVDAPKAASRFSVSTATKGPKASKSPVLNPSSSDASKKASSYIKNPVPDAGKKPGKTQDKSLMPSPLKGTTGKVSAPSPEAAKVKAVSIPKKKESEPKDVPQKPQKSNGGSSSGKGMAQNIKTAKKAVN